MEIKVKKFDEKAVEPYKKHQEDFGYDLTATSVEQVAPNIYKYGVGLGFQIDRTDFEDDTLLSLDIRPRSSVWNTGMVLANSTGTIDELYNGQVFLIFYHVMPDMPKYEVGDKIGQMKLGFTIPLKWEFVDELQDTSRGDGGFGSTGK